jgi:L-Ala-D/L-Glu epimerase
MALHDLRARRDGVPLHQLLGTKHGESIAQSRIVPIKAPGAMALAAVALAKEGYGQVKLKLAGDTPLDVKRITAVREAVASALTIALDANQSYSAEQMISAFKLLQAFAAHVAAVITELPYACEMSEHLQLLDDPFTPVPVIDGMVSVPAGMGCGVQFT